MILSPITVLYTTINKQNTAEQTSHNTLPDILYESRQAFLMLDI